MSVTTEIETAAFEFRTQMLALVGEYQTPSTRKIDEVQFRYVEGDCPPIREQLDHELQETGAVSVEFTQELYKQFCAQRNPANDQASDVLDKELAQLQKLIGSSYLRATSPKVRSIRRAKRLLLDRSSRAWKSCKVSNCCCEVTERCKRSSTIRDRGCKSHRDRSTFSGKICLIRKRRS